jgi:hypothetical protein
MSIYLDTNVLVPTLISEPASATVRSYLATRPDRLISDFAAAELAAALSRLVRMGRLPDADARSADFDGWRAASSSPANLRAVDARLSLVYVHRFELMLRAPDALHLAISHRLQATIVTLDRRMEQAARQLGITVEVPQTT